MNSIDLIRMALKNLWRRKLRTFLTILGVIIGISSILIMMSLGYGMTEGFKNEMSQWGSLNVINVYQGYMEYMDAPMSKNPRGGLGQDQVKLDDETVGKFTMIQGVEAVTPILESYFKFVSGKYAAHVSVRGIFPETMEAFEFKVSEGRLLEEGDTLNLVFGGYIPRNFYDTRSSGRRFWDSMQEQESLVNVLEDRMVMTSDFSYGERKQPGMAPNPKPPKLYKVKGVGILAEGNYENDYYVYMNLHELKKIMDETSKDQRNQPGQRGMPPAQASGYQRIMVKVKDFKDVQRVQEEIRNMGFQTQSLNDAIENMKRQSAQLQAIFGGIGAVSLLVAALGITNTMIMSIYERTKEIGVMKVIGASLSDIRRLFLLEAGLIGFLGGLLGLGLSFTISYILNSSGMQLFGGGMMPGNKMSIIPLWLVGFSMAFTTVVGLISGFYPARRAMKLSPLEAIRTE